MNKPSADVDIFPETSQIGRLGLVHLKGLTRLETLTLGGTKITEAGVANLHKALPNCLIFK